MLELFVKGGPIMWPLLLASVITIASALERVVFLLKTKMARSIADQKELFQFILEGKFEEASLVGIQSSDPVARVIGRGLQHSGICFEESVCSAAERELREYDRGTIILDTLITLAPLLGLLGTVTGMIRSFGLLGSSELGAPTAISGGIAEALIATAFGLGIAIVALIPYNILRASRETLQGELEDAASRVEITLKVRPSRATSPANPLRAVS